MAYITLDFGSSNSGAILNPSYGNEYSPADLIFVHRQDGDAAFTKQPTIFWIKKNLIFKESISESDIDIYSCVFHEKDIYANNANFIWCQNQIKDALPKLTHNSDWVRIQYPKMILYTNSTQPSLAQIKANDGNMYSLIKILRIFFTVIKKECLKKAEDAHLILTEEEINWAITVPGLAIWNQEVVQVIKDIAQPIFGNNITFLSEPECALIGINISGNDTLDFKENRRSLVVDLGGGTADICVMKESSHEDGTMTFDEVKSTREGQDSTTSKKAGGNDIERNFISFFLEYLMDDLNFADSAVTVYQEFLKEQPVGSYDLKKRMLDLLFQDEISDDIIHFNPGRIFVDWLKTRYPSAVKKRDEYGEFSLNGEALRNSVFKPVHDVILSAVEDNLRTLKDNNVELDLVYFAGGLSLDRILKKKIKILSTEIFPYIQFKEASDGAVVGAVQRGGNHIIVNKESLIRRMSRRTFYTEFFTRFNGNISELKEDLGGRLRSYYYKLAGNWLSDRELQEIIDRQWGNLSIDYSSGSVAYLAPLCIKFAPVNKSQEFTILPFNKGNQTATALRVFSSDDNFLIFRNSSIRDEGEFTYDFGYNWASAKVIFDPTSSAVEGTALFYLEDMGGKKLKEIIINNVSKRGI